MTVCIAGMCEHQGRNALAMCCDWQSTYGHFKADEMYKVREIGRFVVMFADDPTKADGFITAIEPDLRAYQDAQKSPDDMDLRATALIHQIEARARIRKRALVDHFIEMTYGVPAAEFRAKSRDWFSERQHEKEWESIKDVTLGCELLIGYADDAEPLIVTVDSAGDAAWADPYGCIGSGADIAISFLCQMQHLDDLPLFECVQRIFIAKQMAEKTLFVGRPSTFVLRINGRTEDKLTEAGWQYLRRNDINHLLRRRKLKFDEKYIGTERDPDRSADHSEKG